MIGAKGLEKNYDKSAPSKSTPTVTVKESSSTELEDLKKKLQVVEEEKRQLEATLKRSTSQSQIGTELVALQSQAAKLQQALSEALEFNKKLSNKVNILAAQLEAYENEKNRLVFSPNPAPEGRVTLVFTDVQGSTVQWEKNPTVMAKALRVHNDVMRKSFNSVGGYEVKTEGGL